MLGLHFHLKIVFSLQYGKSLSIVRLSFVLKSSESLPKYGETKVNSLLGTMKLRNEIDHEINLNYMVPKKEF